MLRKILIKEIPTWVGSQLSLGPCEQASLFSPQAVTTENACPRYEVDAVLLGSSRVLKIP